LAFRPAALARWPHGTDPRARGRGAPPQADERGRSRVGTSRCRGADRLARPGGCAAMSAWRMWTPPDGSIPTLAVPSLEGYRRVHLIGVGGAGMRNLARLLAARGLEVSGS